MIREGVLQKYCKMYGFVCAEFLLSDLHINMQYTYAIAVTYNMTRKQTAVTLCLCVEEMDRSNVYGMVASEMNC